MASEAESLLKASDILWETSTRNFELDQKITKLIDLLIEERVVDKEEALLPLEQIRFESKRRKPDLKMMLDRIGQVSEVGKLFSPIVQLANEIKRLLESIF